MTKTQEFIQKIKNAVKTVDFINLTDNQVENLRIFLQRNNPNDNWKEGFAKSFNPNDINQGMTMLKEICGLIQALIFFHGGYYIYEGERGVIVLGSEGYYEYIGA